MTPNRRKWLTVACVLVGTLIVVGAGRWVLGYLARRAFPTPLVTTDMSQYEPSLAYWSGTGLADHFPRHTPADATDAVLAFAPGFGQAYPYMQLRLKLPAEHVARIVAELKPKATHTQPARYDPGRAKDPDDVAPIFRVGRPQDVTFPDSFTLYVLHADPSSGTCGVAVSEETHEVVYWAEAW